MSSFPAPIQSSQGRLEASCAMKKTERQGQEVSPGLGADSEFGAAPRGQPAQQVAGSSVAESSASL